jgi:hypothetical protein
MIILDEDTDQHVKFKLANGCTVDIFTSVLRENSLVIASDSKLCVFPTEVNSIEIKFDGIKKWRKK